MQRNNHRVDSTKFVDSADPYDAGKTGGESHTVKISNKISKSANKPPRSWHKKYIDSDDRQVALAEEFYQELFRLFDPLQPKTRIAFGKQGEIFIFSRSITPFTTFHTLLKSGNAQQTYTDLQQGIIGNLGSICGSFLLTNEIDLKNANFGMDEDNIALKIDGEWCGARIRIRNCIVEDSKWNFMPKHAKSNITEEVIRLLPALNKVDYEAYNYGEQIQLHRPGKSTQLLAGIEPVKFRKELNVNLLKQILTPNRYFKALALRHAETQEDKDNMMTHYCEMANRRLQVFVAAMSNSSFRNFLFTQDAETAVQEYDDYLHKDGKGRFKMAGKAPIWENVNDSTFELDLILFRDIASKPVDSPEWQALVQKTLMTFIPEIPANQYHETPLHLAAICGNIHILRAVLAVSNNKDINALTSFHDTPLIVALDYNNYAAASELLNINGIDVTLKNQDNISPLMLAFNKMQHDLCCKIINSYPPNDDFAEVESRVLQSLMYRAIKSSKIETMQRLLVHPDIQHHLNDPPRYNLICNAAREANVGALKLLLDTLSSKYMVLREDDWLKCLKNTIDVFNIDKLDLLLTHASKQDSSEETLNVLLAYAVTTNNVAIVKYLITKGANVNSIPKHHANMPIITAAKHLAWKVVELLASLPDCDVNATTKTKNVTALHLAAKESAIQTVKVLLANNADPTIKNNNGQTAADYAKGSFKVQIQNLLLAQTQPNSAITSSLRTMGLLPTPQTAPIPTAGTNSVKSKQTK